jgi:hypothetical protein
MAPEPPAVSHTEPLQSKLARFKQLTFPENAKWARIFEAFCYVYAVVATVLYFLGLTNVWATKIVYYIWKTNPVGIFFGTVPYTCAPVGSMAEDWLCDLSGGADRLDLTHAEFGYGFHISFFYFILGGFISIRVLVFCLDRLESATGIDFLSRVIDKYLPGRHNAD